MAQAGWTDKLCAELIHCEWAQLAAVQSFRNMAKKYESNAEVAGDFSTISSIIDLLGNNLTRAEHSAAALKTNGVLEQRDLFLQNTFKEIPKRLTRLARMQPVLQHPELIGTEPIEAMAKSLKDSKKKLANTVLAKLAEKYRPTARRNARSR